MVGCDDGDPLPVAKDTMTDEMDWTDESRESLREAICFLIRGELRLMNIDPVDIIENCEEALIVDECPEEEWPVFVQFAKEELERAAAVYKNEEKTWPLETDCDRLDRVEAALRERGILFWQVSPCCDSCTRGELTTRIDEIEGRFSGFAEMARGYAFFIDQNMPDLLANGTKLSVYLGYGWFPEEGSEIVSEIYETNALGIAREVVECLQEHGFEPDWDGSLSRKIGLSVNWQRRSMLE